MIEAIVSGAKMRQEDTMPEHDSLAHRLDALTEEFDLFDDWEARYRHIIDLGKRLSALDPSERNETNRVLGCASQVWLVVDSVSPLLHFRGDSDAFIVKGLIALLVRLMDGLEREEIAAMSLPDIMGRLGLNEALSSQRTNGLVSMVRRIQALV